MKKCNIAILGATGAVGRVMIQVMEERNIPVTSLKLLASERSEGMQIPFQGELLTVHKTEKNSFEGVDYVLGAVSSSQIRYWLPFIRKAGAVLVDNSSAYRLDDNVPLVVPQINPEDVMKHQGIIANPNCATIIALMAVNAINKLSPIRSMVVSTYQAVSGAGAKGTAELEKQIHQIAEGKEVSVEAFSEQIAGNLIPQIGDFDAMGFSSEEMKLQNEGRKILHNPDLKVSCTCVRVPVMRCHSESIMVLTENRLDLDEVRKAICKEEGVILNEPYPTPLACSDKDQIQVGRIRQDLCFDNGIDLWCCGDQLRKGAATNAVEILQQLLR